MKEIPVHQITEVIRDLCIRTNVGLGSDVTSRLRECLREEPSPTGQEVLRQIIRNAELAKKEFVPMCQDTGLIVIFIELGQEVRIIDGDLKKAVQEGVRQGTREGYLRNSVVQDPFDRRNTGDNTPAVIHIDLVPGDRLKLTVVPKGGGSENMSTVRMLNPSAGLEGVRRFVIDWVDQAGANPCPPVIVGIGIGGNFERSAFLAKKSLLRRIGERNPVSFYSKLETDLLNGINRLGIGPQGFGGRCTALDVFVEAEPCHIASLPVAINLQCHSARHQSISL
jgi:fumarate hydratase subunit alpha